MWLTGTECVWAARPIGFPHHGHECLPVLTPTTSPATAILNPLAVSRHELYERRILSQLEEGQLITQRSVSQDLGIALGLTNLLIRRLVNKGWVRIRRVERRRLRYLITPAGIAAKARLTRLYFVESLRYYKESRDRIRERLLVLCREYDGDPSAGPIVFFGAGEVAEIAFVCLHETPLELMGVVAPPPTRRFFHAEVHGLDGLSGTTLAGRPFWRLIVMPLQDERGVREALTVRQVPSELVFWL
jgi:DNA-binding MarR family transcriptional regulator